MEVSASDVGVPAWPPCSDLPPLLLTDERVGGQLNSSVKILIIMLCNETFTCEISMTRVNKIVS